MNLKLCFAFLGLAVGSQAIAGCTYGSETYSEGAVTCQNGYEYICRDGGWSALGTKCSQAAHLPDVPLQIASLYRLDLSTLQPSGAAVDPHTITIRDKNWSRVTIQVRQGTKGNCDDDRLVETRILTKGQSQPYPTRGEDVCYRRDADPDHPNGQWTVWTRFSGFSDVNEDI